PGLPSNCLAVQPPPPGLLTVQVKLVDPLAPVVSVAVTETLEVPAVVGVPEIRPLELIDSPARRPEAVELSVCPAAGWLAVICRLTAVPVLVVWPPGLLTVTVLPPPPPPEVKAEVPFGVPQPGIEE